MIRKAALYKDVWKVFFGPSYFECIGLCVSFFQVKLNKNTTKGNLNNLSEFLPMIEGRGGVDLSTIFHSLSTHHSEINLSFSLPISFLSSTLPLSLPLFRFLFDYSTFSSTLLSLPLFSKSIVDVSKLIEIIFAYVSSNKIKLPTFHQNSVSCLSLSLSLLCLNLWVFKIIWWTRTELSTVGIGCV